MRGKDPPRSGAARLCPLGDRLCAEGAPCGEQVAEVFLGAFRNHAAFHEDCSLIIAQRLQEVLEPIWLRLGGYWYPRGGVPIDVFYQSGEPPKGVWLPHQGVPPYRGRG
jgi:QueF-like protein